MLSFRIEECTQGGTLSDDGFWLFFSQTRLQVKRVGADGIPQNLFRGLYDGVLPPLLVGAPSGEIRHLSQGAEKFDLANRFGAVEL